MERTLGKRYYELFVFPGTTSTEPITSEVLDF
eukprot:SAG31_NODE_42221_length_272_cov_1.150289_1_plen_31_part_10